MSLNLKVGDKVRLTGESWPDGYRNNVVTVDRIDAWGKAWSDIPEVGSLTSVNLGHYDRRYAIEKVPTIRFELASTNSPIERLNNFIGQLEDALDYLGDLGFTPKQARKLIRAAVNNKEN